MLCKTYNDSKVPVKNHNLSGASLRHPGVNFSSAETKVVAGYLLLHLDNTLWETEPFLKIDLHSDKEIYVVV